MDPVVMGVDIGGTFTDVVWRCAGQPLQALKLPTARDDPAHAALRAIAQLGERGVPPRTIARFLHGTTIATNAVLERKGARIGLLTSRGFRDVLEIGAQLRRALYRSTMRPETPVFLAPGARRKEVPEQLSAAGDVIVPLDEDAVRKAVAALLSEEVQAVAVCYLFSFLNPAHERRTRDIIAELAPRLMVSLSCEVDPAFREYERTVATAFDAYMKPVVDRYLQQLEHGLHGAQVSAPLQVMQSRGGLAGATVARQRPLRLFLSGPAAGVIGAAMVGRGCGATDLISIDVGGTSSDIALVERGEPLIRPEGRIAGYPVRVPMVDVNAIGAGGGSIAWLDGAGGLRVGPQSAGSDPGPACYGRGGKEATVTDASVVLGWLDPTYFAGGTLTLDAGLAHAAIAHKVAEPLRISVEEAALGMHRVINAQMVEGIRLVSVRRGIDPRRFTLLALGGAGPLHATALAGELGVTRALIPRHPGVLSAAGLLAAVVEHEVSTAFPRQLDGLDFAAVRAVLATLDARATALMAQEQCASAREIRYLADMWYVGQSYHLEVALHADAPQPLQRLYRDFLAVHERVYGHATEAPAAIVNLRAVHRAGRAAAPMDGAYAPAVGEPLKGNRRIRVTGATEAVQAAIYHRAAMPVGLTISGPAIVEQHDTTTLVEPGWSGRVLPDGALMLTASQAGSTRDDHK